MKATLLLAHAVSITTPYRYDTENQHHRARGELGACARASDDALGAIAP